MTKAGCERHNPERDTRCGGCLPGRCLPTQQQDDQDDQEDGAKTATDIRATVIKAAATEQDQQNYDEEYQVHDVSSLQTRLHLLAYCHNAQVGRHVQSTDRGGGFEHLSCATGSHMANAVGFVI
jgi:hypothetical protein